MAVALAANAHAGRHPRSPINSLFVDELDSLPSGDLDAIPKGEVVKAYGVEKEYNGKTYADRVTFVIDANGKVAKVLQGKDALDPAPALDACPIHKKAG